MFQAGAYLVQTQVLSVVFADRIADQWYVMKYPDLMQAMWTSSGNFFDLDFDKPEVRSTSLETGWDDIGRRAKDYHVLIVGPLWFMNPPVVLYKLVCGLARRMTNGGK